MRARRDEREKYSLTRADVARALGVHVEHVRRLDGRSLRPKKIDGQWRYMPAHVANIARARARRRGFRLSPDAVRALLAMGIACAPDELPDVVAGLLARVRTLRGIVRELREQVAARASTTSTIAASTSPAGQAHDDVDDEPR